MSVLLRNFNSVVSYSIRKELEMMMKMETIIPRIHQRRRSLLMNYPAILIVIFVTKKILQQPNLKKVILSFSKKQRPTFANTQKMQTSGYSARDIMTML